MKLRNGFILHLMQRLPYMQFGNHQGIKYFHPGGEWNQSHIIVRGNRVRHYLNGELMVDDRIGSRDWKQRVADSKFKNREGFGMNRDGLIM